MKYQSLNLIKYWQKNSNFCEIKELIIRLENVLSDRKFNDLLPATVHDIIQKLVVKIKIESIECSVIATQLNPNDLPFTDEEIFHEFKLNDVIQINSKYSQHILMVKFKQQFKVTELIGSDYLRLECINEIHEQCKNFNTKLIAHFSHFRKI